MIKQLETILVLSPPRIGHGKIVQVIIEPADRSNITGVVAFDSMVNEHQHILAHCLRSQGFTPKTVHLAGGSIIAEEGFDETGRWYRLAGAGRALFQGRELILFGMSGGYQVGINQTWIPAMQAAMPEYSIRYDPQLRP